MRNKYIFDIPVYRKTRDEFNSEINILIKKRIEEIVSYDPKQRPLDQETKTRVKNSVINYYDGPWQFNQIIGWLRLFLEGNKIGCHCWWIDAKRINRRMRHKRLLLQTYSDILQLRIRNESSIEIFNKLFERLINISANPPYKDRYVDIDAFHRIGPFIDWRKMLK